MNKVSFEARFQAKNETRCSGSLTEVPADTASVENWHLTVKCPDCARTVFAQDRRNLMKAGVKMLRVGNHQLYPEV